MRIIVECRSCHRRYDAKGRRPGAKFRCLCGESLVVSTPRGHDAAVVRCSSCGASREGGSDACGFCHSDFTLHERDLQTICPSCFARVSDKARYCHHCATPLFAESIAGDKTEFRCPVCDPRRRLLSRNLGDYAVAVLECQRCAGLWLGMESLQVMLDYEARGERRVLGRSPKATATDELPKAAARGYRPCIVCTELMTRRNLARGKSGVVVDLCGHHGVWFDDNELARLIAWTRTGGLEHLRLDLARLVGSQDQSRRRHALDQSAAKPRKLPSTRSSSPPRSRPRPRADLEWLDVVTTIVGRLLRG